MIEHLEPITIGTKDIVFKTMEFTGEVDIDQLLQVQYHNIVGDCITFPVAFNRISNLKAEADSLEQTCKLEFEIFVAKKQEQVRKNLTKEDTGGKIKKPTAAEVENAVTLSPEYRKEKEQLIEAQRQSKIIDALYWSAKSKQKMLEVISAKIKPEDFENEILEGEINTVMIKKSRALIPERR